LGIKGIAQVAGSAKGDEGSGMQDPNNTTIFVGGLDHTVNDAMLHLAFSRFGALVYVRVPPGKVGHSRQIFSSVSIMRSKASVFHHPPGHAQLPRLTCLFLTRSFWFQACGFVQFVERASAEEALKEMQGFQMNMCRLRVSWGRATRGRGSGRPDQAKESQEAGADQGVASSKEASGDGGVDAPASSAAISEANAAFAETQEAALAPRYGLGGSIVPDMGNLSIQDAKE
jgi:RNA recognition motif-containing protein